MKKDMNENYVNTLVLAARLDIQRGARKDTVLNSLSRVVDRDLFAVVRERV